MRRAKKGLAILASTVLMVTSAVNYHGLTFSTNVYSEETSNAETVSEVENIQAESETFIQPVAPIAEVPTEAPVVETQTETIAQESSIENAEAVTAETESTAAFTMAESEAATEDADLYETSEESSETEDIIELPEDETEVETETETETEIETSEESSEAETEEEISEEETEFEDGIAVMSLLPLEEVTAYLVLGNKTEDEIKNMSIDEVLNSLQDSDGNKISISEEATTAWRYVKDETDGVEKYEEYPLGQGVTIDMSSSDKDITKYNMELIVGSGNQLDQNNKRYLITIYSSSKITEETYFEVYRQDETGARTKVEPKRIEEKFSNILGMSVKTTIYIVPNHVAGTEYYVGIHSEAAKHPEIQLEVSTYQVGEAGLMLSPCTESALNQDMTRKDSGRKGIYDAPKSIFEDILDALKNEFVLTYMDRKTGVEIVKNVEAFCIATDNSYIDGSMNVYDGQTMVDVSCVEQNEINAGDSEFDVSSGYYVLEYDPVEIRTYMLKEEYSATDDLFYVMNAYGTVYGDDANSYVVKAVEGLYDSLEAAADQPDIKEQLIPTNQNQAPRGYKANYDYRTNGKYFTIFFEDGSIFKYNIRVMDYDSQYDPDYVKSFTDAPVIGEADPWFQITGIMQNDIEVSSFIVQNGSNMNLDTMYGYGYQTVLIQDENVDLSQLQPVFWTADAEHITDVRVNGQPVTSGTVIDCSTGIVQYTVVIDGHQRNYQVKFVKSSLEAKLFVAGPQTQEVFLDEYTEYKHDILIANMGQKELTGLRVELNATNCKLDDYWTVGGENNSTLAPFDSTTTDTEYGVLGNLAKVRLLPLNDEGGDIEGTLTVYADGQEPIVINLTGRAQNPKIVTDQEKFDQVIAVKYVPYSYMITTNCMYDWTDVTYTLTGDLPDGVEWIQETGEIYGVPQEVGTFPITVEATFKSDTYTFESSKVDLVLTVKDNTAENVYNASDDGYSIKQALGTDTGDYNFVLTSLEDATFVSYGEFSEFDHEYCGVWLNGKKLVEGKDYDAEPGSTRITIHGETFENTDYVNQDGENTIALEFRKDGDRNEELKRTSQNFTINVTKPTEPEPTVAPTTAPKPTVAPTTAEPTKPTTAPTTEEPPKPTVAPAKPTAEPTKPTTAPTKPTAEPTNPTTVPTKPTTEETTTAKATTAEESTKEETTTAKHSESSSTTESSTGTKADETKSTVASTEIPETAATAKENETSASSTETTAASVKCTVKMVDAENKAIDNLNLELHSTPQKTLTDANGCAAFDSIEFGSHTLYVKNIDGTTEGSVSFTIAEGNTLALNGNVITAPNGADFILTVRYDQTNLELVSIHDNAARSSEVILGIEDYAEWIGAFLFGVGIAMAMYLCVYAISSAVRRRK